MQVLLNGLIVGSAYGLLGVGFSLLYSTVRYFNLSYGMIGVMGGYIAYGSMKMLGVNFFLALLFAGFFSGLLSLLCGLVFQSMRKRKSSTLVILVASFGVLMILQNLTALFFGNAAKALSISDRIVPGYEFLGLIITGNQLMIGVVAFSMMIILELFLQKTNLGMAIRALGDNSELSSILGLPTEKIFLAIFFSTGILAGISTTLMGLEIGLHPGYGIMLVLKAIIVSIIGGLGSPRGALLGALMLGVSENIGIYFFGGQWQETVAFGLLTVFLLLKPQGLFAKQVLIKT